jgi:hypothetical protein
LIKKNKLGEWAKGKLLGLIMIAQQVAVGAKVGFEFLKLIYTGARIEALF